ncbi:MAG: DUF2089 family protein [bacterium]|nr:DUF2089 family protein [bacterium]
MNKTTTINNCPFCRGEIFVKEFECKSCKTKIVGEFQRDKFSNLSPELLKFAEVFLLNEGNIKGVEETLGCSYPKVKGMLKELVQALGYEYKEKKEEETGAIRKNKRKEVLDMLETGEITVEEAKDLLGNL